MSKNSKRLIVEGADDLHSVVGLMRAHVRWSQSVSDAPVSIHIGNGAEQILEVGYISAMLKDRELDTLGIMLDADNRPGGRYQRVRAQCLAMFPDLPHELPPDGLIAESTDAKRLGLWVMPDNESDGCIEVFLRNLVADTSETIWRHAVGSVTEARILGAPCRDCHLPKAHLYTWLVYCGMQNAEYPGHCENRSLTVAAR